MMDSEKVIGHLNDCMEASRRDNTWVFVRKDIVEDAIVLLKEQEPVEPELEGGGSSWWHVCGECHGTIDDSDNFCRHCGRRIKHEKKE